METIRVLIVDDHQMLAESLARLLGDEPDLEVAGVAATIREAIDHLEQDAPDVALLDYRLPDGTGIEATRMIHERSPQTKVVMLTGFGDDAVLAAALEAGCAGFLTKTQAAGEVADAVRTAAAGESVISAELLGRLLPRLRGELTEAPSSRLTPRELEVLALLSEGLSNKDIADRLVVSINTVRNHVQNLMTKLGAHSKLEAVAIAVRSGIIRY